MSAYIPSLLLVLAGCAWIASGAALETYRDVSWEREFEPVAGGGIEPNDALSARWHEARIAAQTPRNRRIDLGMGLVALGATVALLFGSTGVRSIRDVSSLKAPATPFQFCVSSALCWISLIPAAWCWLWYTQRRGDYPWWADSIAIPAVHVLIFVTVGLPVVLLAAVIAVRGAVMPVSVWSSPVLGPPYVIVGGIVMTFGAVLLLLLQTFTLEPFLIPSLTIALYLLLSGRAAAVVRAKQRTGVRDLLE